MLFNPPRQGKAGFDGTQTVSSQIRGPQVTYKVTAVAPGGPADKAGIKVNDLISFFASGISDVFALAGDTFQVRVQHGSMSRIVELKLAPGPVIDPVYRYVHAIETLTFAGIGLLIGLRRPDSRTARWLAAGLVAVGLSVEPRYSGLVIPLLTYDTVVESFAALAWVRAIAIFPKPAEAGVRPWLDRHAPLIGALYALPRLLLVGIMIVNHGLQGPVYVAIGDTIADLILATAIIISVVDILRTERGQDRQRVFWVLFGTGIAALALGADAITYEFFGYDWGRLFTLGYLAVPITWAYSILRHRVLDIRVALNRTLLYGTLTAFVLVAFVVVEALVERTVLAGKPGGTIVEIVAVVAVGLALRPIHDGVSELLDGLMFRKRRQNVAALSEFAGLVPSISDRDSLRSQTVERIAICTESVGCAIFERDGDVYARSSGMPEAPATMNRDNPLVQKLESTLECVDTDELPVMSPFALAAPMDVHGELAGFIAVGPRRDEDHYDKLERAVIERIAHGVGRALALTENAG